MKFVHIADIHFDCLFTNLSSKENLTDNRRLEQRKVFKKVINYIKENDIKYLFIAGDLYENEYVKKSTIIYINDLFKEIPNTKVFIAPGNHDPYLKNSYYAEFEFAPNVYIFKGSLECKELADCNIYGMGFTSFYCKDTNFGNLTVIRNNKPNILVMHASLDGGTEENREYNPVLESKLQALGMDYVALGHIHKPYYNKTKNQNIVYPGSPLSLGFDELGSHGMIVGEIDDNKKLNLEFVKLDDTEFTKIEQNVENFNSKEDLIEHINELKLDENKFYEIELVGARNFEINNREILKLITPYNILKIKDLTKLGYDLDEIKKEHTIRGLFVKEALKKLEDGNYTKEEIEKAIEIGLNSLGA
jgi:DNA repair exonuclease SbcCD nuclease subunit